MTKTRLYIREKCFLLACIIICRTKLGSAENANVVEPYLIFSHALGLKSLNLTSLHTQNLYSHGHHIFDIDVLWNGTNPQLFWSEYEKGCIYSATLQGSDLNDIQLVVSNGVAKGSVEGIAVDWIAENLYWVESRYGWIEVINLKTKWRSIVVTNIDSPRAIAVDPRDGLLFWTDWNAKNPKIERSSMSGENRSTLVNIMEIESGGFPNGLVIDLTARRIYWIDAKSNSIYSTGYDGRFVEAHLSDDNAIQSPFGLTFYDDNLFWVDAKLNTVNKVNIHNTSAVEVLHKTYHSLYGIAALYPSQKEFSSNPCENNFGCSHLCVLSFNYTAVCKCPAHLMVIGKDGKTCTDVEDMLLVSEFHKEGSDGFDVIFGLSLNNSLNPITLPIVPPSQSEIIGLELDATARFVYWADGNSNAIWRASVASSIVEKVLSLGFDQVTGFGADWNSNVVFYSIIGVRQGIHSCSLISYNCTRLINTTYEPHSLKVLPKLRMLFWVEKGNGSHIINSASFDGSNHAKNPTNNTDTLSGFTVDPHGSTLYWISSEMNSIMKWMSPDKIVTLFTSPHAIIKAIIVEEGHILVSNKIGQVFALDKHTGEYLNVIYTSSGTINTLQPVKLSYMPQGHYNPCDINNGGCEEQCTLSMSGQVMCLEHSTTVSDTFASGDDLDEISTQKVGSCRRMCYNSGQCYVNEAGQASCRCPLGFRGPNCQFDVCATYCRSGNCVVNDRGRPVCLCNIGYYGKRCEMSLCSDFCLNGQCHLSKGRPICACDDGWEGSLCQFGSLAKSDANDMALSSMCKFYCLNSGRCIPPQHERAIPVCRCPSGFSGSRCEVQIVEKAIQITCFAIMSCIIFVTVVLTILYAIKKRLKKFHKFPRDVLLGILPKRQSCNFDETPLPREKRNAFCLAHTPLCKSPSKTTHSMLHGLKKDTDCLSLLESSDAAEASPSH